MNYLRDEFYSRGEHHGLTSLEVDFILSALRQQSTEGFLLSEVNNLSTPREFRPIEEMLPKMRTGIPIDDLQKCVRRLENHSLISIRKHKYNFIGNTRSESPQLLLTLTKAGADLAFEIFPDEKTFCPVFHTFRLGEHGKSLVYLWIERSFENSRL